jgi:hypothetical protein
MLCNECIHSVYESVETDTLDRSEACVDISTRHGWLWPEICLWCRHYIAGICRCRLAGSVVDRNTTFSWCFTLESSIVSWCSSKQSYVALSNAKEEYIALCLSFHEAVWLHKLLANLFGHEMDSTVIHCDNQSCVKLSKNPVFHDKSKHIEIKYHYIRDIVQSTCAVPLYT